MTNDVVALEAVGAGDVALVGGKAAGLGELTRTEGVSVPAGFCVTTEAYERVVGSGPEVAALVEELQATDAGDPTAIAAGAAAVRAAIGSLALPEDLVAEVTAAVDRLGAGTALAVRSSATAEDLPTASFAGQQDTYLNVIGSEAVLAHVRRCWASLFTERAVAYRARAGIDHRTVHMAVVAQALVPARSAGTMFTADPVSGDRTVTTVDASFGLGEAVVSGLVTPDGYRVRDGQIVDRSISAKHVAITPRAGGGTDEDAVDPDRQGQPALTDAQVVELARLGRAIEAHAGRPQDIEWCVADDGIWIVQSRPITTLFPIPDREDDGERHVYLSVGHQQMMTDPMKPLGLSVWKLTALPPMHEAAGRLFVDATPLLTSPTARPGFLAMISRSDPLIGDALQTIIDRPGYLPESDGGPTDHGRPPTGPPADIETDPAIVQGLIVARQASVAQLRDDIQELTGPDLLQFILDDIGELRRLLFEPTSHQAIMNGMEAAWWLNDHLEEWLGQKGAADVIAQSVPGNVTSEMGLELLDVADAIRPHPAVVACLRDVVAGRAAGEDLLAQIEALDGGTEAAAALAGYLDRYGARCAGEIDITRPRWSEEPGLLAAAILGNVDHFEPGAASQRFERGRREAAAMEADVLERLRALSDGEQKAAETKDVIDRIRTFAGFREYPKFFLVSRYGIYKEALLGEADRLVAEGVLAQRDDAFFLSFAELQAVVADRSADAGLIAERRAAFATYDGFRPPRVLTSDGEAVAGSYRRDDVPDGALVGLAVSAGTIEGRARVLHDFGDAELEPGDILVTAFTDPSWTPLFVAIAGLVTEVGGLMTHGAVIAREYGIPAVVGVLDATRAIRDGQRIRVHGTDGFVELLPDDTADAG